MSKAPSRKNNEKRKEKSRVAARCRRNKEQHIFQDLTEALPVRSEEVDQLDKSSVMRLAIAFLRMRDVVSMLPELKPEEPASEDICALRTQESYLQALDGFVLVISQLGDVVYCSDNVTEHLGVSQLEIMGQSVFEFSHPCDHEELREVLRARGSVGLPSTFPLRLKCTLTGKGRSLHLKSASYKVIQLTGHVIVPHAEPASVEVQEVKCEVDKAAREGSLVAVGRPILHPANIEIPLDNKTFLTKHGLDMKFTYSDEVLQEWLGLSGEDVRGQSLYEYQHAADASALALHFKTLFSKGQCETGRYRFLAKCGGYAWVQTQATLITDKQQRPVSVVCVNFLVSGIECKDEIFSANQMRHADLKPASQAASVCLPSAEPQPVVAVAPPVCRAPKALSTFLPNGTIVPDIPNGTIINGPFEEARPRPATAQIFAPRTKDMNKGYLMFSEDDPGLTMLKEEPEDLTHLAPTAGDACIPLEDNPFDMFDEFILNDNYCSLLGEDLANESPVDSLGPESLLLSSPETQESNSSCEQSSLLTELSLDGLDGGKSESELESRAPYIPMTGADDLPLLAPAVMWGALPDSVSLARPAPSAPGPDASPPAVSSLQRLLASPPHTGPLPHDIITNIYTNQGLIPSGGVTTWDTGVKRCRSDVEDTTTKRSKRMSHPPSLPVPQLTQTCASAEAAAPTSSVLMNLLEGTRPPPLQPYHKIVNSTRFFVPTHFLNNAPPINPSVNSINSLANHDQSAAQSIHRSEETFKGTDSGTKQLLNGSFRSTSPLSPLSVNIGSPIFNSPASPMMISPGSSLLSPYLKSPRSAVTPLVYDGISGKSLLYPGRLTPVSMSPKSLSPGEILQTGRDPFLTNKMSPNVGPMDPVTDVMELDKGSDVEGIGAWDPGDIYQEASHLLAFDDVRI